jgi:hypothetical protein
MRLPRYQAQGRPPVGRLDPYAEVATAGCVGGAVVQALRPSIMQYAETRQKADYATKYHEVMTTMVATLTEFDYQVQRAGRTIRSESGEEVPTHSVLLQMQAGIEKGLRDAHLTKLDGLTQQQQSDLRTEAHNLLTKHRQNTQKLERALFNQEKIASADDLIEMAIRAGDPGAGLQIIEDMFTAGVFDAETRDSRRDDLLNRVDFNEVTSRYSQSTSVDELWPVLEDLNAGLYPNLTTEQHGSFTSKILSRMERLDADAEEDQDEFQANNFSKMESLITDVGPNGVTDDDIDQAEKFGSISYQQGAQLRKYKRTRASDSFTDQTVAKSLESRFYQLGEQDKPWAQAKEDLRNWIYDNMYGLSATDLKSALTRLNTLEESRFTSPEYRAATSMIDGLIAQIVNGSIYTVDDAPAILDATLMKVALFQAVEAGTAVDPVQWVRDNLKDYTPEDMDEETRRRVLAEIAGGRR